MEVVVRIRKPHRRILHLGENIVFVHGSSLVIYLASQISKSLLTSKTADFQKLKTKLKKVKVKGRKVSLTLNG